MVAEQIAPRGHAMAKKFSLDDTADFQTNLRMFALQLGQLDPILGPELIKTLGTGDDRDASLDALLMAISKEEGK